MAALPTKSIPLGFLLYINLKVRSILLLKYYLGEYYIGVFNISFLTTIVKGFHPDPMFQGSIPSSALRFFYLVSKIHNPTFFGIVQ